MWSLFLFDRRAIGLGVLKLMTNLETVEETPPLSSGFDFEFADVRRIVTRHRWLVVGCVLVSLAAAFLVSYFTKPLFRATALITLERERENPLDLAASVAHERGQEVSVETVARLLTSREVLERAVRKLRLAEPARTREPAAGRSAVGVEGDRKGAELDPVTRLAVGLAPTIDVRPIRNTSLLEVSVTAYSAQRAADLANGVMDAFIAWKLDSRFRLLGQAVEFLSSQIVDAKASLAQKEERLLAFGRRKEILSGDPSTNAALTKLEALQRDAATATADRITKEARAAVLLQSATLADSLTTPLVTQLRSDVTQMEREYQEKLSLYKPNWPAMQQLKAQIEKRRLDLANAVDDAVRKAREAAHTDMSTAQRREEVLRAALQAQRSEAMSINADAVEYNTLKVETETQRALVDNLLKRQAEILVLTHLEGERVSDVRIVESALPPNSRFRPSYRLNGLVGLVAGIFFGLATAFALERLDRTLRTPEQITEILKLPVLGVIPATGNASARGYGIPMASRKGPSGERPTLKTSPSRPGAVLIELLPHEISRSPIAEAYRAFRTSLLLSSAELLRSFVITSAVPLEGKTTTATNLAVVLAQLGKNVLLVDADLHRSRLHEIFHVSNAEGLVSVLAGRIDVQYAVQKTAVPGLTLLPAGPPSPNPSGLLASDTMRRFLDEAIARYDYVVIDAPPVLAVADAIILGYLSNGVILTVRGGQTPREQVSRALSELRNSNVRVLGVLINALDEKNGASDRERYGGAYYPAAEPVPAEAVKPPAGKAV
jgi:succinoglycan biosynthesis transport protein ExoP